MKITQCKGEGQGSCKRCSDRGKWNVTWMCFLYKIENYEGQGWQIVKCYQNS